ncbi:MAG TPA: hypothetical protein VHD38_00465 [Candidatus Paceibacterota bacterium]|nr:hypothetical protein [Candidatus Paceibacterota bacterium]
MNRSLQFFAYVLLGIACATCVGIYIAAGSIRQSAIALSASAANAQAQEDRIAYQKRLAALATDTQNQRAELEALVSPDVVSIVNELEAAGNPVHLSVTVNDAQTSGAAQDLPGGGSLHAVTFLVESQGSYASLMRLETLFENLPLASVVDGVEMQELQDQKTPWHLTARIRIYTTAQISS